MDMRPYFYGRHNDDYDAVVAYLASIGKKPFTKIIWNDLRYECTGTWETIRIAYRREKLGSKLTNRAPGGFLYTHVWTAQEKAEHSVRMTLLSNTPQNKLIKHIAGVAAQNRPDVKETHRLTNQKPDVRKRRKDSQNRTETKEAKRAANTAAHARSDVKDRHREGCRRGQNTETAKAARAASKPTANAKRSLTLAITNAKPETIARRSAAAKDVQSREDIKLRKSLKLRGEGNASSKLTSAQVLEILLSPESSRSLSLQYQVSYHTIRDIKTRKTWQHLVPEKII
jgi:hypothetical protein